MLVFVEGGKPENQEKNPLSEVRTNNKLNPQMALSWNQKWVTWGGGGGERQALSPLHHPLSPHVDAGLGSRTQNTEYVRLLNSSFSNYFQIIFKGMEILSMSTI